MKNTSSKRLPRIVLILFAALISSCGDDPADSSVELGDTVPRNTLPGVEGRTVYLRRHSTRCGSPASNPLSAEVDARVEFLADRTRKLDSPCPGAPSPGVEIGVDSRSLTFDFSKIEQSGAFPQAGFEGYELAFARRCGDPAIASASVDAEYSTAEASKLEVLHHYDRVSVNFERMAYNPGSFVKVDLQLVDVDCMGDEGAASYSQASTPD